MAKILLIDDDINIHQIVSLFLENAGHSVACVASGQGGLDYARHNDIDLIILDLAMPGMDGIETNRALKADPQTAEIPVMILSVHDETEFPESICNEGCVGFIIKPVNMNQLVAGVEEALAK